MAEIEAAPDRAAALAEQPDPPDPIVNGRIDLGQLAAEFLALGLDPYPRKPGVEFAPVVEDGANRLALRRSGQTQKRLTPRGPVGR